MTTAEGFPYKKWSVSFAWNQLKVTTWLLLVTMCFILSVLSNGWISKWIALPVDPRYPLCNILTLLDTNVNAASESVAFLLHDFFLSTKLTTAAPHFLSNETFTKVHRRNSVLFKEGIFHLKRTALGKKQLILTFVTS